MLAPHVRVNIYLSIVERAYSENYKLNSWKWIDAVRAPSAVTQRLWMRALLPFELVDAAQSSIYRYRFNSKVMRAFNPRTILFCRSTTTTTRHIQRHYRIAQSTFIYAPYLKTMYLRRLLFIIGVAWTAHGIMKVCRINNWVSLRWANWYSVYTARSHLTQFTQILRHMNTRFAKYVISEDTMY